MTDIGNHLLPPFECSSFWLFDLLIVPSFDLLLLCQTNTWERYQRKERLERYVTKPKNDSCVVIFCDRTGLLRQSNIGDIFITI